MSDPAPDLAALLGGLRRVLDVVEARAVADPAFAADLRAALGGALNAGPSPFPSAETSTKPAPKRPRAKKEAAPGPLDVFVSGGPEALRTHLAALDDAALAKAARGVGLRVSKKEDRAALEGRIVDRAAAELNRGQAFSRRPGPPPP